MNAAAAPMEKKLVLPPARASELIKKLRGEPEGGAQLTAKEILLFWEQHGAQLAAFLGELEGAEELEFSTGETAKAEKLAAGQAGNIFIQRGIALASGMTAEQMKLVLFQRKPERHKVTIGGSILVSSDIRKPPEKALKKVNVDPALEARHFEQLGLGFSDLQQTGGIPYLFALSRAHLAEAMTVTAAGEDPIRMGGVQEAEAAIAGKKLELAVLERMKMGS